MDSMKENVSDQIIKVLDNLANKIGVGIDWGSQNIMPQLLDLLNRIVIREIIWSILAILGFTMVFMFLIKFKNQKHEDEETNSVAKMCVYAYGLIYIIATISHIYNIVNCILTPELIWLERITEIYYSLGI